MVSSNRNYFWREGDPLWYKDAVIYEVHVRAFYDHSGDGIGDFAGLTEKLNYLHDLGVTAIWLLPFYPSPLRDDGYDVSDYTAIHPNYGTIQDFKTLLREAHFRGLRVITELVINHTSDQHVWFQRARHAEAGSPGRNFYVWSDTGDKFADTRIIFKDFETSNWTWDTTAKAYYWHRFYSHQPDLNFDNPQVQQAIFRVLDFWLGMGVSGLRLDAVPYLYEREGTNCENLPETHEFLKKLRNYVDKKYGNRMLLAEANQWSEDAVAYFGQGDESHLAFNFPLMPRMFMAIRMEDRFPIIDIMQNTPVIPDNCQWALFLRNHDELTLEMVTDEERDYMYRMYAYDSQARINLGIRRRLAPLLNNDRKKIELMNAILFSLPGTPIIYYGDEIGMGDNFYLGDRNGVRTPMQWSGDRNAGFSRANPQQLFLPVNIDPEYHYEAVNAEVQQNNTDSLLWWMRRIIALRKRFSAFGRGSIEFLQPDNRKVLVFIRRYKNETILVVANLSRSIQHASLELNEFTGQVPTEIFGQTEFPPIGETPYFLTLSPYAFYWFSIEPSLAGKIEPSEGTPGEAIPTLTLSGEWTDLYKRRSKSQMQEALLSYIKQKRWYGGKTRRCNLLGIEDYITVPYGKQTAHMVIIRLEYTDGEPENYMVPITFTRGEDVERVIGESPNDVIAHLRLRNKKGDENGLVYEAIIDKAFRDTLLKSMMRRRRFKSEKGEIVSSNMGRAALNRAGGPLTDIVDSVIMPGEQSNTSVSYENRFKFKLLRHLEEGLSPELEIGRFLTTKQVFSNTPPVIGSLEYHNKRLTEPVTLGILHGFTPNEGD
ncbi:maltose alpha-D-glucosyltransferase, partial [Chloroflexota bacterium]